MSLTVSAVLATRPETLADTAGRVAASAAATEADIATERANLAVLADSWSGSASATAQSQAANLLAAQERYLTALLDMQQVLASGGAALTELRTELAVLVTGEVATFWQIADDGTVTPGSLLAEYAALSPVTELQVTLMALGLELQIRQLLADFEGADARTAMSLQACIDNHSPAGPPRAEPDADGGQHPAPETHGPTHEHQQPGEPDPGLHPGLATPNTVPGPHGGDPRYETGQTPTLAGSPGDSPRMRVAPGSSDQVRLQDNPPGFSGAAGPERDAAWQAYLSRQGAATPGVVTAATVLPNPDAVADPGLKTVGAAAKQQGVSYAWGGGHVPGQLGASRGWRNEHADSSWAFNDQNRTGFDCSGLARFAAAQGYGVDISAGNAGNTVGQEAALLAGRGRAVPDSVLRPGDLIYYGPPGASHHVVVYAGNGLVVQAQVSGEPVEVSPIELGEQHRSIRPNTGRPG